MVEKKVKRVIEKEVQKVESHLINMFTRLLKQVEDMKKAYLDDYSRKAMELYSTF